MNFLLLRGQVPQDRDPQEIVFNHVKEIDDVWSLMFAYLLSPGDMGEIWYWGGKRKHRFAKDLMERWVPSFATYKSDFVPDVIFCRGGFQEYHHILKKFPKACKIYYGAGIRYLPQHSFTDYDLVIQDSPLQVEECNKKFPNIKSELFIKPAPDNLFYPLKDVEKEYDICYPADGRTKRKGHQFVYSTIPSKYKTLNLGFPCKFATKPDNVTSYRILKSNLSRHMQKCKMGIVTSVVKSGGGLDSCPRVLPELLACDIPVVVLDETLFWKEKYMDESVGLIASRDNFWEKVEYMLNNLDKFSPRDYYLKNLSLKPAARHLRNLIMETLYE